jgi:hypothetical protein
MHNNTATTLKITRDGTQTGAIQAVATPWQGVNFEIAYAVRLMGVVNASRKPEFRGFQGKIRMKQIIVNSGCGESGIRKSGVFCGLVLFQFF